MKKKILLFLLLAKLNKHKNLKLEIDNFRKDFENIEVEIHEMTNLLKINTEDTYANLIERDKMTFSNLNDWKKRLSYLEDTFGKKNILIFNEIRTVNINSFKICHYLKKNGLKFFEFSDIDMPTIKYNFQSLKLNKIKKYNLITLSNKMLLFFKQVFFGSLKKIFKIYPNFYLAIGRESINYFKKNLEQHGCKLLKANSMDYNLHLISKRKYEKISAQKFGVFIEASTPFFFGDALFMRDDKKIIGNPKQWSQSLDSFFSYLEEKFKLEIFIASHPRVKHKNDRPEYYCGRKVITRELSTYIKDSSIIINRDSTGIAHGIINSIPIAFVNNFDLVSNRPNFFENQSYIASVIKKKPINMDLKITLEQEDELFKIDHASYRDYMDNYVTMLDNQKSNSKIISEIFNINYD